MPRVFRQQYTRPIPEGAKRITVTGKKGRTVEAVRFVGNDGKTVTAPVVTKGKGAGTTCRVVSPNWYGRVNGERVTLCPNKAASETMLAELVRKAGLAQAGASDPFEEHRKRPLSSARAAEAAARRTTASPAAARAGRTWPTSAATSSTRATPRSTPARPAAAPPQYSTAPGPRSSPTSPRPTSSTGWPTSAKRAACPSRPATTTSAT
jgi:hypothetical protein